MAGYTRQSTANIVTGAVIDAADFNAEYNAIEAAFNASTGHTHDGTTGNGPPIENLGPSADLVVTSSVVRPKVDNTYDLGTSAIEWKDAFFDGTVKTDVLTVDETSTFTGVVTTTTDVNVGGALDVTGNLTVDGSLTLGNGNTDNLVINARIDSSMIPDDDNAFDLGSSTLQWRNIYIDGLADVDSLFCPSVDINGGSIDGTTIGANSAAAITATTINASGNITGSLVGNASTASTLATARTISLTGDVTGSTSFNGSANVSIAATLVGDQRLAATTDVYVGNLHEYIHFNDGSSDMRFWTGAAEDMRLTSGGDLHVDGNVIAYSTTISDERLKHDIQKIDNALDKVSQINGYTFSYNKDGKKSAGVIAQELEKVLPSAVENKSLVFHNEDDVEYKTVQYDQLHGLLIEAIKELKAEIEELKNGSAD